MECEKRIYCNFIRTKVQLLRTASQCCQSSNRYFQILYLILQVLASNKSICPPPWWPSPCQASHWQAHGSRRSAELLQKFTCMATCASIRVQHLHPDEWFLRLRFWGLRRLEIRLLWLWQRLGWFWQLFGVATVLECVLGCIAFFFDNFFVFATVLLLEVWCCSSHCQRPALSTSSVLLRPRILVVSSLTA